jgi:hypothetical protein
MVMVYAPEPEAQSTVHAVLQSNGWSDADIKNLKLVNQPFHSDDPILVTCHENAIKKGCGIVVYWDPIDED